MKRRTKSALIASIVAVGFMTPLFASESGKSQVTSTYCKLLPWACVTTNGAGGSGHGGSNGSSGSGGTGGTGGTTGDKEG